MKDWGGGEGGGGAKKKQPVRGPERGKNRPDDNQAQRGTRLARSRSGLSRKRLGGVDGGGERKGAGEKRKQKKAFLSCTRKRLIAPELFWGKKTQ